MKFLNLHVQMLPSVNKNLLITRKVRGVSQHGNKVGSCFGGANGLNQLKYMTTDIIDQSSLPAISTESWFMAGWNSGEPKHQETVLTEHPSSLRG